MKHKSKASILIELLFSSLWTWVFLFVFIIGLCTFPAYDDTDDKVNGTRSGMVLYTDNLTGCQYLKAGLIGGITPRLDVNGNHVGCK